MQSGSTFSTVIRVYYPQQGENEGITNTTFLHELTDLLTEITGKYRNIIILGDFNIHIDNSEDPDAQVLIYTSETFNSKQHILFPNNNQGHILDLIATENNTLAESQDQNQDHTCPTTDGIHKP